MGRSLIEDVGRLSPALLFTTDVRGRIEYVNERWTEVLGAPAGTLLGTNWIAFVHVDDAAAATVRAVERGRPGNIYNIVDDEPAEVSEWLPALAQMSGAKPPFHLPAWIARLVAGEHMVSMMTQVRAGSNIKAKRDLDWEPLHPSWREGFAAITRQAPAHKSAA